MATIAKRKLNEAKGEPLSTITFPVIKAEDQRMMNKKDNLKIVLFNYAPLLYS